MKITIEKLINAGICCSFSESKRLIKKIEQSEKLKKKITTKLKDNQ